MTNYAEERAVRGTPAGGLAFQATLDPAAVAAAAVVHEAFAVPGVIDGDVITDFLEPAETANVAVARCRVSADDQVTITFVGGTGGGDPASGVWTFYVRRPSAPGPGVS